MNRKRSRRFRFVLTWGIAVLLPALASCHGNRVKLNGFTQPDAGRPVEAGKLATLTVDVSDPSDQLLTFVWRAERGTVMAPSDRAKSAIYKAPDMAGEDTITVQVLSAKKMADETSLNLTICRAQTVGLTIDQFVQQKDEVILNTQARTLPGLVQQDGIDMSAYDLQITFWGGDGKNAQLFYKDKNWKNVYSLPVPIKSNQPIRFSPKTEPCRVCEFNDFTHIYGVGAMVSGGISEVKIISAKLVYHNNGVGGDVP